MCARRLRRQDGHGVTPPSVTASIIVERAVDGRVVALGRRRNRHCRKEEVDYEIAQEMAGLVAGVLGGRSLLARRRRFAPMGE